MIISPYMDIVNGLFLRHQIAQRDYLQKKKKYKYGTGSLHDLAKIKHILSGREENPCSLPYIKVIHQVIEIGAQIVFIDLLTKEIFDIVFVALKSGQYI